MNCSARTATRPNLHAHRRDGTAKGAKRAEPVERRARQTKHRRAFFLHLTHLQHHHKPKAKPQKQTKFCVQGRKA